MKIRLLALPVVAIALIASASPVVAARPRSPAAPALSGAGAVRGWNEIAVGTLLSGAIPVPEQPLYLAYVHRAVYLAVHETAGRRASFVAAASVAAHDVLVEYFSSQQGALDADLDASLAAVPAGLDRRLGVSIGRYAATAEIRERRHDGRNGPTLPVPPPGPGVWVPTPPNPAGVSSWLGGVTPFTLDSADQFRPDAPPALSSSRWAADYNETRIMGSATSSVRTSEQTEVARSGRTRRTPRTSGRCEPISPDRGTT